MAFAGMAESDALKTISYYSMGSLVCVFIFAALLKNGYDLFGQTYLTPDWQPSPQPSFIYTHLRWYVTPVHFSLDSLPLAVFYSSVSR